MSRLPKCECNFVRNSLVRLDARLCDALVQRQEFVEVLRWDDLMERCFKKMTACHQITFIGSEPQIDHIELIGTKEGR